METRHPRSIDRSHIFCLVYTIILIQSGESINTTRHAETKLQTYLFDGYDPNVRPSANGESITADVGLSLNHIVKLDELKQTLTLSLEFVFLWKDDLLTWNEEDYNGLQSILVPINKIWLPDIVILNCVNDAHDIGFSMAKARLYKNGSISVWTQVTKEVTCTIHTKKFPFDKHHCLVEIALSRSDIKAVNLSSTSVGVSLARYKTVAEWDIVENYIDIQSHSFQNINVILTDNPLLNLRLTFKRSSNMSISNIILPVFLLYTLNILTFLVPISSGEKLTFPMSIFLAVAVFLTAINEDLSEAVDGVSYLAIKVTLELCYCTMTLSCAVIVLRLYHRMGDSKAYGVVSKFEFMFNKKRGCGLKHKIHDMCTDSEEYDRQIKGKTTSQAPQETRCGRY